MDRVRIAISLVPDGTAPYTIRNSRTLGSRPNSVASFSRALLEDLRHQMSDAEFDRALGEAIDEIYQASTVKEPVPA